MENIVFPITIVEDRYSGVYSGAKYLALNLHHSEVPVEIGGCDLVEHEFFAEGGDCENYQIGKGDTPDMAMSDLKRMINNQNECDE